MFECHFLVDFELTFHQADMIFNEAALWFKYIYEQLPTSLVSAQVKLLSKELWATCGDPVYHRLVIFFGIGVVPLYFVQVVG